MAGYEHGDKMLRISCVAKELSASGGGSGEQDRRSQSVGGDSLVTHRNASLCTSRGSESQQLGHWAGDMKQAV
jgi:hypothetical protein